MYLINKNLFQTIVDDILSQQIHITTLHIVYLIYKHNIQNSRTSKYKIHLWSQPIHHISLKKKQPTQYQTMFIHK